MQHLTKAANGPCRSPDHCDMQPARHRRASIQDQFIIPAASPPRFEAGRSAALWEGSMKASVCKSETPRCRSVLRGIVLTFTFTFWCGDLGNAADVKVLSSPALRGVVSEIGRQFEGATGQRAATAS